MDPILKQLYQGGLFPQKTVWQYQAEQALINDWQKSFEPLLHEQAPALDVTFKTMMGDVKSAYRTGTEAMFYKGFSLAVKLLGEALSAS